MLGKQNNLNKNHRSIGGLIIASMCSHLCYKNICIGGRRIREISLELDCDQPLSSSVF